MLEIKAPDNTLKDTYKDNIKLFLAGSIEMGTAEKWQDKVCKELKDFENLLVFNPRRDDWDSSWIQSIEDKQFYTQVSWEWEHIHAADIVLVCFDPNTKSPITLLELGVVSQMSNSAIVVCPEGFWRKGNVDIVCGKSFIPLYTELHLAIVELKVLIPRLFRRLKHGY